MLISALTRFVLERRSALKLLIFMRTDSVADNINFLDRLRTGGACGVGFDAFSVLCMYMYLWRYRHADGEQVGLCGYAAIQAHPVMD
jgi:hypothetical protein